MPAETAPAETAPSESAPAETAPSVSEFRARCRRWLADQGLPPIEEHEAGSRHRGVAVFHNLPLEDEQALLGAGRAWQARKYAAGFGAISWPTEYGGAALTADHERAFAEEEAHYAVAASHEALRITVNLAAPTLRELGTSEQRARFVPRFLGCEDVVCQLFSEPDAGSDLAGITTRARADGDEWVIDGSKVWTSGAQLADWGFLIARTNPERPKHQGLTAFLVPMSSEGVAVRPIRQMSGGGSFSEVFLADVRIADGLRVGEIGGGWKAALTMLGFERNQSGTKKGIGGSWAQLHELARSSGRRTDPVVRQRLMAVYEHERLRLLTRERADAARLSGNQPGPEGSIGKLLWSQGLTMIGEAAQLLLGPALTADTGSPGTYMWTEHLLGAPGFRIAGGSDEIQRNIIGERVLGLPPEPRPDSAGSPQPGKGSR